MSVSRKKKILIIDDDQDIIDLIVDRLKESNFECYTATFPTEGLEKAAEFKPDLVLLDLMLPKMSGFGFMREFKLRSELAHIPVVVLTALADEDIAEEAMNLGAAGYLTKACSAKELLSVVKEYASSANHSG